MSALGDFLEELHDRNMDLVAYKILDHLDVASLQSCLQVCTLWRNLVLEAVVREPTPDKKFMAAKIGQKTKPFFAPRAANQHKLDQSPEQTWMVWVRNFKGWKLWMEEGLQTWQKCQEDLEHVWQGFCFSRSFPISSQLAGGRKLRFSLSRTERGLLDLDTKQWVWRKHNERDGPEGCRFFPFAGQGFVGIWNKERLCLFSLEDGRTLMDEEKDLCLRNPCRLGLPSKNVLLVLEPHLHECTCMDSNKPMQYKLIRVGQDGSISETVGCIARPSNDQLCSARLFLDSERFLVAAAGDDAWQGTEKPQSVKQFFVWDLLQPDLDLESSLPIVSAIPLTDSSSDKFAINCSDVIDGVWMLNITPTDSAPNANLVTEGETNNGHILCFDKNRTGQLKELSLKSGHGALKFEEVFP